jgi:DNA-binding CsgD family transcriptional regulator
MGSSQVKHQTQFSPSTLPCSWQGQCILLVGCAKTSKTTFTVILFYVKTFEKKTMGLKEPKKTLTRRQQEIFAYIKQGILSNVEIGEKLFISPHTVKNHKENMKETLDCSTTLGLLKLAMEATPQEESKNSNQPPQI